MRHISVRDFAPDDGARNHFAVRYYRANRNYFESMRFSQFAQQLRVACLLVAKPKVLSHQHRAHAQLFNQNCFDELLRTQL